ncbi:hypothetical protein XA68_15055 [Ophiocordyceps unilateralis]|uniref:Uncharacterized protein n=1 Tax=Ophiocordyceps unilateralis TaxID=268505 RepID=A0A2A9P935_OPHUN|nr:hypothetical protein XA68_15055 [Ophiocordyceps unilateralis]
MVWVRPGMVLDAHVTLSSSTWLIPIIVDNTHLTSPCPHLAFTLTTPQPLSPSAPPPAAPTSSSHTIPPPPKKNMPRTSDQFSLPPNSSMPSNTPIDSDRVWTSLITNLNYLPALLTLNYSLRHRAKSSYPLLALYTDSFPEQGRSALARRDIPARRIPYLLPTESRDYSHDPRFYDCWSKLAPFSLTEFKRVVQLDADMLVLRNMDELMTLALDQPPTEIGDAPSGNRVFAAGHACVCNPLRKSHYPSDWTPQNCAFSSQHSDPEAAQTVAPDPAVGPLGFMNGGLQVVNPSNVLYAQIVAHMEADAVNMDFADQSLLSDLYRGRWLPLPYVYNALKTMRWQGVHDAIWRDDEVKNVHYILSPKPWDEMDQQGNWTGSDETHRWWVDVNRERKAAEREQNIPDDGF